MDSTSTASTRTAKCLLWALFGVNVYRAATQSITGAEALTYLRFVHPQWKKMLGAYDANNHILNTLLAKMSLTVLPLSEFAVRLPSVLFGGLYLWAVWRVARRAFGTGALFLAAVALLTLNPLVLDHLSAARGYGMAMACWMWALDFMLVFLGGAAAGADRDAPLSRAGLFLALCVAGNVAFVYPAVALGITFWLVVALRRQAPARTVAERFLVTALVASLLLLALPLAQADAARLYSGGRSVRETVRSLVTLSLYHGDPGADPGVLDPVARIGLGALAAVALVVAVRRLRKPRKTQLGEPVHASLTVLTGGTMALTFLLLIASRRWLGTPYPSGGAALYFIPVSALAALALLAMFDRKPASVAALVLAAILSAQYARQFNVRVYGEWPEDVESASLIRALVRDSGKRHIRVGASAAEEPVVNFYRERRRQRNWEPAEPKLTGNYDYFVLGPRDAGLIEQRRLKVVYRDLNLTLARPGDD